jgi:hypothetical protein
MVIYWLCLAPILSSLDLFLRDYVKVEVYSKVTTCKAENEEYWT